MGHSIFRKDATAQGVAKQRLIESLAAPTKRVIHDPLAERFVLGSGFIKLMGHKLSVWITQKFAPGLHEHLIARTRFIDDLIERCAVDGTQQYVILGAGYDSRAHRLELPSTLQVFEVDQPEVQAQKRAKLPNEVNDASNVTYVGVDFNHQSLTEQLLSAGFDKNRPTVFTLEGVSQYIPKQALASTLQELATLTQSSQAVFFMSYVDERLTSDPISCFGKNYPKAIKRAESITRLSAKFGEPWISLFSASEIEALLNEHGFVVRDNKTVEDLNSKYFTPLGRTIPEKHIFKLEHFVVAESKLQ